MSTAEITRLYDVCKQNTVSAFVGFENAAKLFHEMLVEFTQSQAFNRVSKHRYIFKLAVVHKLCFTTHAQTMKNFFLFCQKTHIPHCP